MAPRLTTALISVQPQFVATGELVAEYHKDDRDNNVTDIYYAEKCVTKSGREYRFHHTSEHGIYTVESLLAELDAEGYKPSMTSAMVFIEDIGEVSQWASEKFYNQSVEVSF